MDCKKALVETDGNIEAAVDFLREKGLAKAAKKAGRIAAEGLVKIATAEDGKTAALVEVNSETDFVSKNEEFVAFVDGLAKLALTAESNDIEAFKAMAFDGATVQEALTAKIAKIGENMSIRRIEKVSGDVIASYIHGGGRIGVIVAAKTNVKNDAIEEALKNIAMQVAALNPKYVSDAEVSAEYIEHEKEILKAQILADPKESQKPEKVIDGMINGRIKKELKEVCLMDQVYVKAEDGKQTVAQYVDTVAKANGADLKVVKFVRFETGEGLEKKNEDFAAEVAAQLG
ncbi:MAG: translation elongation factor Ts [Lachnospiraceae bacterium]|nr:translation elongation factor Ts [Lachnospiraceae bacterium]